jgi:hypothetical protein
MTNKEGLLSSKKKLGKYDTVFIHGLAWFIIFGFPFLLMDRSASFDWRFFFNSIPKYVAFMFVFYLNYFLLIKKYLFEGKNGKFILINVVLIIGFALFIHYGNDLMRMLSPAELPSPPRKPKRFAAPSPLQFIFWHILSLGAIAGLSVALRVSSRWSEVENERKELEKAKSEAELQNLKNQVSPHFLLNTLNNIYALIEFNPPKAQEAVMDLGKLLRHLLYDNNHALIPLQQEVDFINNYIDLMRIRLADNVRVSTDFLVQEHSSVMIPPLIYISLIENAFKHGVSVGNPSFIEMKLTEKPDSQVEFVIRNSYFPKTKSDMSGSGIGLGLVKKRLELLYFGRYTWKTGIKDKVYETILVIDTLNAQK